MSEDDRMGGFTDYRTEYEEFSRDFPEQRVDLSGGGFDCILAGPADARHTLVFLNGGMNSSRMWMPYVKEFSRDCHVLAFDFPQGYATDRELCSGIHGLLSRLGLEKVVLVGASFGGFLAQIYAKAYPDDVEAMCLMSTGGLTGNAMRRYGRMLKLVSVAIWLMKVLPYDAILKMEKRVSDSYIKEADEDDRRYFADMFDGIYSGYTKEKDIHIEKLMRDLGNQDPATKEDFRHLAGAVMLLLPEDDSAFPKELQDELVEVMTDPIVVRGIRGGHLATLIDFDAYAGHIRDLLRRIGGNAGPNQAS